MPYLGKIARIERDVSFSPELHVRIFGHVAVDPSWLGKGFPFEEDLVVSVSHTDQTNRLCVFRWQFAEPIPTQIEDLDPGLELPEIGNTDPFLTDHPAHNWHVARGNNIDEFRF